MDSAKIIKLFFSSGLWRAAGSLTVLLVTFVIAKRLGAESSGLFFLSFALISFISNISRFGMDNAVLKLVSINYKEDGNKFVSAIVLSAILFSTFVSSILGALLLLFSESLSELVFNQIELNELIESMVPYMLISSWCIIISMVLQAMQKFIQAVLITNLVTNLIFLTMLFVTDNLDVNLVVLFLSFSTFVTFILGLVLVKDVLNLKVELTLAFRDLIKLSTPLFIIVICNQSALWAGQIFLGIFGTASDVSNFAVAQRISMLVTFFLMSLNLVVAPKYARLYKSNDVEGLNKLVILAGRVNVIITVPIVVLIFVFSSQLTNYLGADYEKAAFALLLLTLGQFFNALTGSVSYLLSMTGREKLLRNNSIISAILMMILCLLLIPSFGVYGAASATAIGITVNNLLNFFGVYRSLGINSLKLI